MMHTTLSHATQIAKDHWNITGDAGALDSEWGGTFRITVADGTMYLLKITPDNVDPDRVALEMATVTHLQKSDVASLIPQLLQSNMGDVIVKTSGGIARMYIWIPGRTFATVNPQSEVLLSDLGARLGMMSHALQDFDHPAAHFASTWDPAHPGWVEEHIALLPNDLIPHARYLLLRYRNVDGQIGSLRHGVQYADANDYNIIVTEDRFDPQIAGFTDFGDVHYGPVINELAICLAYAMMHTDDPLAKAMPLIKGYHYVFALTEEEVDVLFDLIRLRLLISLVHAALRYKKNPSNTYWQISAQPADRLFRHLITMNPHFALCCFRHACGWEPSPLHDDLVSWLRDNTGKFFPVMGFSLHDVPVTVFDWSVGGADTGGFDLQENLEEQTRRCFQRIRDEDTRLGIGRYDEPRAIYTTSAYAVHGVDTHGMRTIHLGIDLFMPAGTPVYAPFNGKVVTLTDNAGDKEYGPLIILEHITDEGLQFYTLYGHNSHACLERLTLGQHVRAGEWIAEIGDYPGNGNWVPHLHFQIITHLLGFQDDFPGVADPGRREVWLSICPDPNLMLGIVHPVLKYHYADIDGMIRKRHKVLAPNLSLAYRHPLHIVRGWMTTLYDEHGRTYLDTCNNIAHVGHEHPDVVRAGQQQMALLNTNSRYLHRQRMRLAQALLETLPGHLEVLWLVNSGSEANELALRIARAYTGRQDAVVLEDGYHGITQACIDVSHYKFRHLGQPPATHVLLLPRAQESADGAIHTLDKIAMAHKPLVFIHESLPSCAGQVIPHEDFFMDLYAVVKRDGGVCIADEVQTGLGRTGERYWAFELFTIAPDIVTIGKPLGNGHPVAAVACTRMLAERFAEGPEFFSSFGGNPVSCAIAAEVIDIVAREDLQRHASETGMYWMSALRSLKDIYPAIGDVRGHGLFIGIEITDPEDGSPSRVRAQYLEQRMLDHRILTTFDGAGRNVMKIKPPMCISRVEVDRFLEVLEKILREDAMR